MGRLPALSDEVISQIKTQINSGVSLERVAIAFKLQYEKIRKINCGDYGKGVLPVTEHEVKIGLKRQEKRDRMEGNRRPYKPQPDFSAEHPLFTRDGFLIFEVKTKKDFNWYVNIINDMPEFSELKISIDIRNPAARDKAKNLLRKREAQLKTELATVRYQLARCELIIHAIEANDIESLPQDCYDEVMRDLEKIRAAKEPRKLLLQHNPA